MRSSRWVGHPLHTRSATRARVTTASPGRQGPGPPSDRGERSAGPWALERRHALPCAGIGRTGPPLPRGRRLPKRAARRRAQPSDPGRPVRRPYATFDLRRLESSCLRPAGRRKGLGGGLTHTSACSTGFGSGSTPSLSIVNASVQPGSWGSRSIRRGNNARRVDPPQNSIVASQVRGRRSTWRFDR